ncbi:hypothetical protein R6Q57_001644 [Mikania cordata]
MIVKLCSRNKFSTGFESQKDSCLCNKIGGFGAENVGITILPSDSLSLFSALEVLYLAIIGGTYYLIVYSTFNYIPGHYMGGYHRYTSLLAVGVGIILFLLTSFSDPGTINAENVFQYLSVYPYDNILYSEKECSTCKILKPARSKHCSICDRCVARFDHHCGWMNNCIGEKNTLYFVLFLLWHFFLCVYGTIAIGLVLAGRLKELEVVYILTAYYGIENSFRSLAPHVVQWLINSYNTQILVMVFLAIVSLLLSGFFGYHFSLCISNTTTNETFKWEDYLGWQRKVKEAKASAEALKASLDDLSQETTKPQQSRWKKFFRRSRLEEDVEKLVNGVEATCFDLLPKFDQLSLANDSADHHNYFITSYAKRKRIKPASYLAHWLP